MTEDPKRRNPNQRSYHLDDETVALLDAKAQEMTVSQSAVVRMAIRAFCGQPSPLLLPGTVPLEDLNAALDRRPYVETFQQNRAPSPAAQMDALTERQIVLPPEGVSEFRVQKTREGEAPAVQQRRPRSAFEDEGY